MENVGVMCFQAWGKKGTWLRSLVLQNSAESVSDSSYLGGEEDPDFVGYAETLQISLEDF